jgi:nitrate reductase NapAB chaperone NapD
MPVCSYLVIPEKGQGGHLTRRLGDLPGCDVVQARNQEVLLLVTDTPGPDEDRRLRSRIEALPGIHALVLSFGEIDPETEEADPVRASRQEERRRSRAPKRVLPVVDPGGLPVDDLPRVLGSPPSASSDPSDR